MRRDILRAGAELANDMPSAELVESMAGLVSALPLHLREPYTYYDSPARRIQIPMTPQAVYEHDLALLFNPLGFKVAIIGRPNVGKSTLTNLFVSETKRGKTRALVDKSPGMTRDRKEIDAGFGVIDFVIIDTPGLEVPHERDITEVPETQMLSGEAISMELQSHMILQAQLAIQEADVIIFVYEPKDGMTYMDKHFADWVKRQLRTRTCLAPGWWARSEVPPRLKAETYQEFDLTKRIERREYDRGLIPESIVPQEYWDPDDMEEVTVATPVICVGNKAEEATLEIEHGLMEGLQLGFGAPIAISAHHKDNLAELWSRLIVAFLQAFPSKFQEYRAKRILLNAAMPIALRNMLARDEERAMARDRTEKDPEIKPSSARLLGDDAALSDVGDEGQQTLDEETMEELDEEQNKKIQLVIAGKPNVGKSSLINSLIKEKRLLVGDQPGVTRDSCQVKLKDPRFPELDFTIVDTAGLKGITTMQHKKHAHPDALAMAESIRSIKFSSVVALTIDASQGILETLNLPRLSAQPSKEQLILYRTKVARVFSKHDIGILRKIEEEGRAMVVLANKWDKVKPKDRADVYRGLEELLLTIMPQAKGVLIVKCNAAKEGGEGVVGVIPAVVKAFNKWNTRIGTGRLNQWLGAMQAFKPHPEVQGQLVNLKYMTQVSTRPPAFVMFTNRKALVSTSYSRFLLNALREEFDLEGVPVRLHVRQGKNPFGGSREVS